MEILFITVGVIVLLTIMKFVMKTEPAAYFAALGVSVFVGLLCWALSSFSFETMDTELLNGEISAKVREARNCPTGWNRSTDWFCSEYKTKEVYDGQSCDWVTRDGKKKKVCHDEYHTEYKYYFDWEARWIVHAASIGERWEIRRVDRQGANEPPFWTKVQVGDPASTTHGYTNWVKGAADSIFHEDKEALEKYKEAIPEYPMAIYDIYKVRRIVPIGVTIPDIDQFNNKLSNALKTLGPMRQMNAIIVVADSTKFGPDLQYAVRRAWSGFKKNDAVTFIGIDKDNHVQWANSLSWSKASIYDIEVREKILEGREKPLDLNATIDNIQAIAMKTYQRRSMEEFEFLKSEIQTPTWLIVIATIFQSIALIIAFILSRKEF